MQIPHQFLLWYLSVPHPFTKPSHVERHRSSPPPISLVSPRVGDARPGQVLEHYLRRGPIRARADHK